MPLNANFLDINTLLEAKKAGQLEQRLSKKDPNRIVLDAEDYFIKLLEMEKTATISGLSVKDIKRREFHTNY